jgi:hypothetical protein
MTDQTADRTKALDKALGQIEKNYGKGAIMRLGADEKMDVAVIPTGCLSLDLALGIGGIPRGRVVEIYGPESSGKTTLALHVIAEAQRKGGVAAFIDAEHALDVTYARKLGVRTEDLLISQPDSGEQAMEITEVMDLLMAEVSLRRAWDISRAWEPIWASPMSPSISERGTRAATESTTATSMALERTKISQISMACSPESGWEMRRSSVLTPSFRA